MTVADGRSARRADVGEVRISMELAVFGASLRLYVVHRNAGPVGAEGEEVQLDEMALAAMKVEVLGAVDRLTSMFRKSSGAANWAKAQSP
jgi:hypothetical protein